MELIQHNINESVIVENAALICGSSLIYDIDFQRVHNFYHFNHETELLDEEVARRLIRIENADSRRICYELRQTPTVLGEIFDVVLPFNLTHPYNWFHFLVESMPTLMDCINKGYINSKTTLVSGRMHANMFQLLDLLFGNKINIFQIELTQAVICKKILISNKSYVCHELKNGEMFKHFYYDKDRISAFRELIDSKTTCMTKSEPYRNVFIIRSSLQRNIVNLSELIKVAKAADFQIVDPGLLSLHDQLTLFSEAKRIVGPTGAWLANLLFANKDCVVSVLNPNTTRSHLSIWKELGNILGISVQDYYFDVPAINPFQPIHSDFLVDLDNFKQLFRA